MKQNQERLHVLCLKRRGVVLCLTGDSLSLSLTLSLSLSLMMLFSPVSTVHYVPQETPYTDLMQSPSWQHPLSSKPLSSSKRLPC